MKIITDDIEHAGLFCAPDNNWHNYNNNHDSTISPLLDQIFDNTKLYINNSLNNPGWNYLLIKRSSGCSQYDKVIDLHKQNIALPHGILCIAGEGVKFHGFRERPWAAPKGNIYLTASFAPNCKIDKFGVGFLTLAAVSVIEAIDTIPELKGRAGIKWVNDILIEGAKVCGVLAHTQQEGEAITSAVLGIGLNVLTVPNISPTPFVPKASALIDFINIDRADFLTIIFSSLIRILDYNYSALLKSGYRDLLDKYRKRSIIIGREIQICADLQSAEKQILNAGIVERIGENLELYLADQNKPVNKGRLVLLS